MHCRLHLRTALTPLASAVNRSYFAPISNRHGLVIKPIWPRFTQRSLAALKRIYHAYFVEYNVAEREAYALVVIRDGWWWRRRVLPPRVARFVAVSTSCSLE